MVKREDSLFLASMRGGGLRSGPGFSVEKRAVHQIKGLVRGGGTNPLYHWLAGIRKVENTEEGGRILPFDQSIDCPSPRKRCGMDLHGPAPQLTIKPATRLQGGITP